MDFLIYNFKGHLLFLRQMWSFYIELGGFLWTIPSERLSNIHPVFCLHTYVVTDLIPYSTEIDLELG